MEVYRIPEPSSELYHHGIIGMHWGVRRYQNPDGTLTSAGRKHKGLIETIKVKRKMKKLRNEKVKKQAEKKRREDIINTGDAREIDKIKNTMTDAEYERALSRIKMNTSLQEYKTAANRAKLEDISNKVTTIAHAAGSVADAATKAANVYEKLQQVGIVKKKESEIDKLKKLETITGIKANIAKNKNIIENNGVLNKGDGGKKKNKGNDGGPDNGHGNNPSPKTKGSKKNDDFDEVNRSVQNIDPSNPKSSDGYKITWLPKGSDQPRSMTVRSNALGREIVKSKNGDKKVKYEGKEFNKVNRDIAKKNKKDAKEQTKVDIAEKYIDNGMTPKIRDARKRTDMEIKVFKKQNPDIDFDNPKSNWVTDFNEWKRKKGLDHSAIPVRRLPSWVETDEDLELYHHGVKGMKWGVRRYQNPDGTLTTAGANRYGKKIKQIQRLENRAAALRLKSKKVHAKSAKKEFKSMVAWSNKSAAKKLLKAKKLERKSARLDYKAEKKLKKGQKIYKRLNKEYKNTKMNDINPEFIDYGKKYAAKYLK